MIVEQCERKKDHALEVYDKRFRRTTRIPDEDDDDEEEMKKTKRTRENRALRKKCRSSIKKLKNRPIEAELLERTHQLHWRKQTDVLSRSIFC